MTTSFNSDTYSVYEHKNKENNKRYIGITSQPVEKRWKKGCGYGKSTKIYKAIKKYGWDGFEHNVLFHNLSKSDAERKEIELIYLYNTTDSKYGYNIQNGGSSYGKFTKESRMKISQSKKGQKYSEEARKNISLGHTGKKHWSYGKKFSLEHKKNLSKAHMGQKAWNKGIKRSKWLSKEHEENLKERQRQSMIGNKLSCKPVICIETNVIYEGGYDAYLKTNINFGNISEVCNGRRKTAGGYHWQFVKGDEIYQESLE